jgi:hypothetical protein
MYTSCIFIYCSTLITFKLQKEQRAENIRTYIIIIIIIIIYMRDARNTHRITTNAQNTSAEKPKTNRQLSSSKYK